MKRLIVFIIVAISIYSNPLKASDTCKYTSLWIAPGLYQVKESYNLNKVYKGLDYVIGMNFSKIAPRRYREMRFFLGGGVIHSSPVWAQKNDDKMKGYAFEILPYSFYKGHGIFRKGNSNLYIGPEIEAYYNYNVYPNQNSGFFYWYSEYSVRLKAIYLIVSDQSKFTIKLSNNVAGLISRPSKNMGQYFFSLNVFDLFSNLHKEMKFSSVNRYMDTNLSFSYQKISGRVSVEFCVHYFKYFPDPILCNLAERIGLTINL